MTSRIVLHPGHPCVRPCASTSSTVLLQQAAWRGVLRPVRGCVHAALPRVELPLLASLDFIRKPTNMPDKDHSCSSTLPDQHRCGIPAQISTVNAHKWILIIVPWMLLMSTFKTLPATHCLHQSLHGMWALRLGFRGSARPRQQPDTFSVLSSITLAVHVWLFLCRWSDFAFLLGIFHSHQIKFDHFALSS